MLGHLSGGCQIPSVMKLCPEPWGLSAAGSRSQDDLSHSFEAYISISAYFAYLQVSVSEHVKSLLPLGEE